MIPREVTPLAFEIFAYRLAEDIKVLALA